MDFDKLERIAQLEYYLENYQGCSIGMVWEWKKELNELKGSAEWDSIIIKS